MSYLIDTTEMYLRTVYELIEEGIPPMRARITERLHQSGPTVSQTVARMERDGLLQVQNDRTIQLSEEGYRLAEGVMRKHRLAERLLLDMIGLEWELVHDEACRWEHVMSEEVERRLIKILNSPTHSPYGNPIPGLAHLGTVIETEPFRGDTEPLSELVDIAEDREVVIVRMSEHAQAEHGVLEGMARAGVRVGVPIWARGTNRGVILETDEGSTEVTDEVSDKLYCRLV